MNSPLVSCLCVSNRRPLYLKKTIESFLSQTYEHKELIIISFDDNPEYSRILEEVNRDNIRYFTIPPSKKITLGDLRNLSIEKASGKYICNWDDDDWYHCRRLELQVAASQNNCKQGSILAFCLMYDQVKAQSYLSFPLFHPATVLCEKGLINANVRYPSLNQQEDSGFVRKLYQVKALFPLINPIMYIYIYHGSNTLKTSRFRRIFKNSYKFPDSINSIIRDVVAGRHSYEDASGILEQPAILSEFDYFLYGK